MPSLKEIAPDLLEKYEKARKLLDEESLKDRDNVPFLSKYAAREILCDMKRIVNKLHEDISLDSEVLVERLRALGAAIDYHLGVLAVDTEELSTGEEHLQKCLVTLQGKEISRFSILIAINALNQLGVLWSMRNEPKTSREHLEKAEALCKKYRTEVGTAPYDVTDLIAVDDGSEDADENLADNSRKLEKALTHTLYYLAQVYSSLNETVKAALYCHTTLKRQLEADEYDAIDWALNAATLSQFFVARDSFADARHHMACATYMLDRHESDLKNREWDEGNKDAEDAAWEGLRHRRADVARCWVKYDIDLLVYSKEHLMHQAAEEEGELSNAMDQIKLEDASAGDLPTTDGSNEETGNVLRNMPVEIEHKPHMVFKSMEVTSIEEQVSAEKVLDFQQARDIFLHGQKYINLAKEYYSLSDHASENVEVIQDMSKLYKILTFFEPNEDRQSKMHKRRVDLLEAVLKELNPRYYLNACRQLQFELAETYSDIMDIKQTRLHDSRDNSVHIIKKINHLSEESMKYYQAFLDSFRDGNKMMPELFPEELTRPALLASFCLGRLHTKIMTRDHRKQVEFLQKSLECYQFVVDYCNTHPETEAIMREELGVCREMVKLLPMKLEKLMSVSL